MSWDNENKKNETFEETDLWGLAPEIEKNIQTPRSILRKYKENLGRSTGDLLQGSLTLRQNADDLLFSFYIVAPKLKDYKFLLFQVDQPITMYPLHVIWSRDRIKIENERELLDMLKHIVEDEETKRLLSALIAQSKSV